MNEPDILFGDVDINVKLSLTIDQIIEIFKNKQFIKLSSYGYLFCEYQPEKEGINPFSHESFKIPSKIQPQTIDPQVITNIEQFMDKAGISCAPCELLIDPGYSLKARQFLSDSEGEVIGKLEFPIIKGRVVAPGSDKVSADSFMFSIRFAKSVTEKIRIEVDTSYELVTSPLENDEDQIRIIDIRIHEK